MAYMTGRFYLESISLAHKMLSGYSVDENDETKSDLLSHLSVVNMLVGPNNSGKSRLMRNIIKSKDLTFSPAGYALARNKVRDIQEKAAEEIRVLLKNHDVQLKMHVAQRTASRLDFVNVKDIVFNERSSTGVLTQAASNAHNFSKETPAASSLTRYTDLPTFGKLPFFIQYENLIKDPPSLGVIDDSKDNTIIHEITRVADEANLQTSEILSPFKTWEQKPIKRYYIPTLRGLRPINGKNADHYRDVTTRDYFPEPSAPDGIVTGLNLYDEVKKRLLGDLSDRKMIRQFEEFIAKEFFNGSPVAIIPKEGKEEIALKIGNEKEQQIYDLGDGLQSLIIILFCVYETKKEPDTLHLIFIEEPELFMHPGLQRLLLQKLVSDEFPNCQFFMTTHSNHFLDITFDYEKISIFSVTKKFEDTGNEQQEPTFLVRNVMNGDKGILKALGIRDSSVFLSNCTIWVEGITDRMYLRHYLQLYMKTRSNTKTSFKEDQHFSFVEYGGSNLPHFDFSDATSGDQNVGVDAPTRMQRISKEVLVIADGDSKKENKHKSLQKTLGKAYYRLHVREVENLVAPAILEKVIGCFESKKGNENFTLKSVEHENYADEYLGTFITSKLFKTGKPKYAYKAPSGSGTIRDKDAFARAVIDNTQLWEQLSKPAQETIRTIYKFIQRNNHD